MPTILREAGFRFHFFSADGGEPPHIHIDARGNRAKIWLVDIRVAKRGGFSEPELSHMIEIVSRNQARLLEAWNEFFP